ncbi:MAG: HEAT repeat domain-containing protein [Bacteroidota bacterium]
MRQTFVVWAALVGTLLSTELFAQRAESSGNSALSAIASGPVPALAGAEPMNQDDPGYELYKEGYNLILTEDWEHAQLVLDELIIRHPRSDYVDDAYYWSAYALKYINRETAAELYREFIRQYRESSYYDDAVADLNELESVVIVRPPKGPAVSILREDIEGHTFIFAPSMKKLEREFRRATRAYRRVGITVGPGEGMPTVVRIDEDLDRETMLKMEALYALGDSQEDEESFTTLRKVALDLKQPQPMREAAMESLSGFERFDVVTVFVDIAQNDTSPALQSYAVDYIGELGSDENEKVSILIDLFGTVPKERTDQRETIFFTIADVGNDKAVDFLSSVALSQEDYLLRREAVYYLGSIGGSRARNALLQILSNK